MPGMSRYSTDMACVAASCAQTNAGGRRTNAKKILHPERDESFTFGNQDWDFSNVPWFFICNPSSMYPLPLTENQPVRDGPLVDPIWLKILTLVYPLIFCQLQTFGYLDYLFLTLWRWLLLAIRLVPRFWKPPWARSSVPRFWRWWTDILHEDGEYWQEWVPKTEIPTLPLRR